MSPTLSPARSCRESPSESQALRQGRARETATDVSNSSPTFRGSTGSTDSERGASLRTNSSSLDSSSSDRGAGRSATLGKSEVSTPPSLPLIADLTKEMFTTVEGITLIDEVLALADDSDYEYEEDDNDEEDSRNQMEKIAPMPSQLQTSSSETSEDSEKEDDRPDDDDVDSNESCADTQMLSQGQSSSQETLEESGREDNWPDESMNNHPSAPSTTPLFEPLQEPGGNDGEEKENTEADRSLNDPTESLLATPTSTKSPSTHRQDQTSKVDEEHSATATNGSLYDPPESSLTPLVSTKPPSRDPVGEAELPKASVRQANSSKERPRSFPNQSFPQSLCDELADDADETQRGACNKEQAQLSSPNQNFPPAVPEEAVDNAFESRGNVSSLLLDQTHAQSPTIERAGDEGVSQRDDNIDDPPPADLSEPMTDRSGSPDTSPRYCPQKRQHFDGNFDFQEAAIKYLSEYGPTLKGRCRNTYGWEESYCDRIFQMYRNFLRIKIEEQDWETNKLIPPEEILQIWRQHVLDTKNYLEFCRTACGDGPVIFYDPDLESGSGSLDAATIELRRKETGAKIMKYFHNSPGKQRKEDRSSNVGASGTGKRNANRDCLDQESQIIHRSNTTETRAMNCPDKEAEMEDIVLAPGKLGKGKIEITLPSGLDRNQRQSRHREVSENGLRKQLELEFGKSSASDKFSAEQEGQTISKGRLAGLTCSLHATQRQLADAKLSIEKLQKELSDSERQKKALQQEVACHEASRKRPSHGIVTEGHEPSQTPPVRKRSRIATPNCEGGDNSEENRGRPPPSSGPPDDIKICWKFCHDWQILCADFQGGYIQQEEKDRLLSFMERDDFTIVCFGLLNESPDQVEWESLLADDTCYTKFQRRVVSESSKPYLPDSLKCCDRSDLWALKFSEFSTYLRLWGEHAKSCVFLPEATPPELTLGGSEGSHNRLNIGTDILSVMDLEVTMDEHPQFYTEFVSCFQLYGTFIDRDTTTNGDQTERKSSRGPMLNVSPPGLTSNLLQNCEGRFDFHLVCLRGYLEIVTLRRLDEHHIGNAINLFHSCDGNWPTNEVVQEWRDMGYCPSVFILKPREYVHINRRRLFATRTLSPDPLPREDCHAKLREQLVTGIGRIAATSFSTTLSWGLGSTEIAGEDTAVDTETDARL